MKFSALNYGVYKQNCGLRNVNMSWGHDEYVYQMLKDHLPRVRFIHAAVSLFLCLASRRRL